jgi:hypothetical protein
MRSDLVEQRPCCLLYYPAGVLLELNVQQRMEQVFLQLMASLAEKSVKVLAAHLRILPTFFLLDFTLGPLQVLEVVFEGLVQLLV